MDLVKYGILCLNGSQLAGCGQLPGRRRYYTNSQPPSPGVDLQVTVISIFWDLSGLLLRMELSSAKKINYIVCYIISIGALQKYLAKSTSTLRQAEFKVYYLRLVRYNLEICRGSKKGGWPGQGSGCSMALVRVLALVSYLD